MFKLDLLCIVVFSVCMTGHGSIKLKAANITCRGGQVENSLSYNVTTVPGCSQDYLPEVNCSDIPAGPVNYTGSSHGNMFQYVWEARNDVGATGIESFTENNHTQNTDPSPALRLFNVTSKQDVNVSGSYSYLKGFKMVLWVQDGLQYPYQLGHCYFVHVLPPARSQADNRLQGQFSLQCTYQDCRRISVISILSSYPTPKDCYGNQENPRWKMINLTVPAPTSTLVLTTTAVQVLMATDLDVTGTHSSELVYGSVAAVVSIVLIVCLVICFKRRKKTGAAHAASPAANFCPSHVTVQSHHSPPAPLLESRQDGHYTVTQSGSLDSPDERAVQHTEDPIPTNLPLMEQPTNLRSMAPTDIHLMEQHAVPSSVNRNAPQKCKQGSNCRKENTQVTKGANMQNLCHRHAVACSQRPLFQSLNALPQNLDETQSTHFENREIIQERRDASEQKLCETRSYVGDAKNNFIHRSADDTVQTSTRNFSENHCQLHRQGSQQNIKEICTFPKETSQNIFQLPDEIREQLAAINDSDNDSICV